jgi:hypothetical protein
LANESGEMLGKQVHEVGGGGFNKVRLIKVGSVNNEIQVIKVHNLDYQGMLQIMRYLIRCYYLMFAYNYYNYFQTLCIKC